MAVSSNSTFSGASFVPFAETSTWIYGNSDDGKLKIYVKFANSYGSVVTSMEFSVAASEAVTTSGAEIKTEAKTETEVEIETGEVLGVKINVLDDMLKDLKLGSRGKKVAALQNELKKQGFFPKSQKTTEYYGKTTAAGIKKYLAGKKLTLAPNAPTNSTISQLILKLKFGMKNNDVKKLQDELKKLNLYPKTMLSTGYYGKATDAGVKKYKTVNS